jgi:outer membrane protein assembly factor BamB
MTNDGMKRSRRFALLVLLLLPGPSPGRAQPAIPWTRPDSSVNSNYPNVLEQWRFDARQPMAASPAVAAGRVFAGDASGKMRALSLRNGALQWEFTAAGPITSTPEADEREVVFASADGSLYALNPSSGKKLWQFAADQPVTASPCVTNNMVYCGAGDGKLRALGLEDGKLAWQFSGPGGAVESRPLVCNGRVIFSAADGCLYAVDEATGLFLWQWKSAADTARSLAAVCLVAPNPKLFLVAPDRLLAALDPAAGNELWRTNAWQLSRSIGLAEDGSRLYARTATHSVILAFATAADHARKLWEVDASLGDDTNSAMLAERQGVLYYGSSRGLLLAIDPRSGTLLWEHQLGPAPLHTVVPLEDANEVVVSDAEGRVTRVGPRQH